MSELADIQKAIETAQTNMTQLFDAQKKEIAATGEISKKLQTDLQTVQADLTKSSTRLFDLEQKLAAGSLDNPETKKSFAERTAEDLKKSWNGSTSGKVDVKTFNKALGSGAGSAGTLIQAQQNPGILMPGLRRLTIRDLINWGRTSSNAVEFVRELVFTNNAAPVSENPVGLKPESNITFDADSAPVVTIAHWVHASKQVLSDVPMLQSYIDGRLRAGLKLKEEDQLLKGSGVGLNIDGIYTQATAYSQPAGAVVDTETQIDRLRLAMLQVVLSEYAADGIVLHPTDWANVELLKTSDKAYLFANPRFQATPSLWGLPVVTTTAMTQSDFLVGVFGGGLAVQGWDREDISLSIATQDDRDFVKNMVKLLVEERLALTVYRPSAFVKGDFDGLPASV